jgi:hypothetical protein
MTASTAFEYPPIHYVDGVDGNTPLDAAGLNPAQLALAKAADGLTSQVNPSVNASTLYLAALNLFDATAGPRTPPLPPAASTSPGVVIGYKKVDGTGNFVTPTCTGADRIDSSSGPTSLPLKTLDQVVWFVSDGVSVWTTVAGALSLAALDSRYILTWLAAQTAACAAVPGQAVPCDTTGGTFPVTLTPSSVANGVIRVKWRAGLLAPTVIAGGGRALDPTWLGFGQLGACADFSDDGATWNIV